MFDVPAELAVGNGTDVPFEFRFSHFGNAVLEMTDVAIAFVGSDHRLEADVSKNDHWRLLGRLKTLPLPGPTGLSPFSITRLKFGRLFRTSAPSSGSIPP